MINNKEQEIWFENAWKIREEQIYPALFGTVQTQIYTLTESMFAHIGSRHIDPRWLTNGVLIAQSQNNSWIYLSSGLSNPWGQQDTHDQDKQISGIGFELWLESKQHDPRFIKYLQWVIIWQLLIATGVIDEPLIDIGDRIVLPETYTQGVKDYALLVNQTSDARRQFLLPSGKVDLLQLIPINSQEAQIATEQGGHFLIEQLKTKKQP